MKVGSKTTVLQLIHVLGYSCVGQCFGSAVVCLGRAPTTTYCSANASEWNHQGGNKILVFTHLSKITKDLDSDG